MKTSIAGIQARMGSTRLPRKSLADVAGKPLVQHIFERLSTARHLEAVVVLTSTSPADDALAELCEERGIPVRRGPERDVLARFLALADEFEPDHLVRVTGDCPLVSPAFVDLQLEALAHHDADFTTLPLGWPTGAVAGQGAMSARALRDATESPDPRDREHVGSFWFAERADRFRTVELRVPCWLARSNVRITVDEPADLALVRRVFEYFSPRHGSDVPLRAALRFLDAHPALRKSNLTVRDAPDTGAAHAAHRTAPRRVIGHWPLAGEARLGSLE